MSGAVGEEGGKFGKESCVVVWVNLLGLGWLLVKLSPELGVAEAKLTAAKLETWKFEASLPHRRDRLYEPDRDIPSVNMRFSAVSKAIVGNGNTQSEL